MRRGAVWLFFAASTVTLAAVLLGLDSGPLAAVLRWSGWFLRLFGGA